MEGGQRGRPPRVEVFTCFATQIGELRDRPGGLPAPVEAQDIWTGIWYQEAPLHSDRGQPLSVKRGRDGQWRSSRNWVEEYLTARYERHLSHGL